MIKGAFIYVCGLVGGLVLGGALFSEAKAAEVLAQKIVDDKLAKSIEENAG